jgi:hypothetical protein
MALIEKFHTIADHYPVAAGQEIVEGMWVKLNASGEVVVAAGANPEYVLGIAGDTKSTSVSGLPATNNAMPNNNAFVNRVSDMFDETRASGRMTVYHSAGIFLTNQYVAGAYAVNDALYVDPANPGLVTNAAAYVGQQVVARVTKVPHAVDSGVPGLDATGILPPGAGTMALMGSYMEIRLVNA